MDSLQHTELGEAEVRRLREGDARKRDEIARVRASNAALTEKLRELSAANAESAAAKDKALRETEDYRRALGETGARAKGYRKQAEDRQAAILKLQDQLSSRLPGKDGGSPPHHRLHQENAGLRAEISNLRRTQESLRQAAHTALGDERRKFEARLQEQLSRIQGPEGFNVLRRENSDLRRRLSEFRDQHAELRRQAQIAIDAAEGRARAAEAGRAVAVDLGRRLQSQLSSVMDGDPSGLHQGFPVGGPATASSGRAAAAPPPAPSAQKIPKHLREIERWFDGIPERFRDNVPAAKLGQHLQNNANNRQGLEDAIAHVKKLTTQATPLIPRSVLGYIMRGPEGWESPFPDTPEAMGPSPSAPASAPILPMAFASPGMITPSPR